MKAIDEYVESKLKNKEFFDAVMPKAITFLNTRSEVSRLRLYNLMSMRLGHTTGEKMLYKDIAKVTLHLINNTPVSNNCCSMLYRKGLRLSCRAIKALGRLNTLD